jgi:hypothetical protein
MQLNEIPCPFIYANGKKCVGLVVKIEAYKADLSWVRQEDGTWEFDWGNPRSHYHLSCSLKGNHTGYDRPDDPRMKFYFDQLPDDLRAVVAGRLVIYTQHHGVILPPKPARNPA